jgi:UDP-N-acetylglucosamine 2-epimerase
MAKEKVVAFVFGTRPEAIKMAPVVRALEQIPGVRPYVLVTAQHRQMLDQVLQTFGITPDTDLNVMTAGQTLSTLTSRLFALLGETFSAVRPDAVLVQGDTTSAMVGAMSAYYAQIPVGHVEAGLRTHDIHAPFPEEVNRSVVSCVARWNFAPTALSRDNLLAEGRKASSIHLTGNTIVDALSMVRQKLAALGDGACLTRLEQEAGAAALPLRTPLLGGARMVLITGHRRENFGQPLRDAFGALRALALRHSDVTFVYPVHLNPNVQGPAHEILDGVPNLHLLPPLSYVPFTWLLVRCHAVVTDSGGVQEEAAALGRPTLVTRDVTERPEALAAGTALLVGPHPDRMTAALDRLLTDHEHWKTMSRPSHLFGDGTAGTQIAQVLAADLSAR